MVRLRCGFCSRILQCVTITISEGAAMKKIATPKGIKVSSHLKAGARYSWFK
jgi:hypothetical protein